MINRASRRLGGLASALLLSALLSANCHAVFAADMFGRAEHPPAAPQAQVQAAPSEPAHTLSLPTPIRNVIGRALAVQSRLNGDLRAQLRLARKGESWRPAFAIVLLSFLYGVFHAVGPGHGKVVVGSYFLSRRAKLMHGLAMSGSAALVQSMVAVVLVSVLAAVLDLGGNRILAHAATLETVSYGAITALGLWMAWGVLTRRACCAHADEPGHEPAHDHAHHCGCGHEHEPHGKPLVRDESPAGSELTKVLFTGAAVGLRPCSGAILVLLFTLANQIYPIGIMATFAMGLGVAITVALVSLTTLGVQRSLAKLGANNHAWASRIRQAAALGGALFITAFGALQLLGIWSGAITPMAG